MTGNLEPTGCLSWNNEHIADHDIITLCKQWVFNCSTVISFPSPWMFPIIFLLDEGLLIDSLSNMKPVLMQIPYTGTSISFFVNFFRCKVTLSPTYLLTHTPSLTNVTPRKSLRDPIAYIVCQHLQVHRTPEHLFFTILQIMSQFTFYYFPLLAPDCNNMKSCYYSLI